MSEIKFSALIIKIFRSWKLFSLVFVILFIICSSVILYRFNEYVIISSTLVPDLKSKSKNIQGTGGKKSFLDLKNIIKTPYYGSLLIDELFEGTTDQYKSKLYSGVLSGDTSTDAEINFFEYSESSEISVAIKVPYDERYDMIYAKLQIADSINSVIKTYNSNTLLKLKSELAMLDKENKSYSESIKSHISEIQLKKYNTFKRILTHVNVVDFNKIFSNIVPSEIHNKLFGLDQTLLFLGVEKLSKIETGDLLNDNAIRMLVDIEAELFKSKKLLELSSIKHSEKLQQSRLLEPSFHIFEYLKISDSQISSKIKIMRTIKNYQKYILFLFVLCLFVVFFFFAAWYLVFGGVGLE